jgi:poly(A)-specific ribonuclease
LARIAFRLFLMMLRDNQYIHLGGQDRELSALRFNQKLCGFVSATPSRDHVFYLTFPKDWKFNNIIELFSPFGELIYRDVM